MFISRLKKSIWAFLLAYILVSVVFQCSVFSQNIDIPEYINESIQNVVFFLEDKSIEIDWASKTGPYQVLSYNIPSSNSNNKTSVGIRVKCFFKRGVCIGKVINLSDQHSKSINQQMRQISENIQNQKTKNHIEIFESSDHITIYIYNSNIDLLKRLNTTPLLVEPIDDILLELKTIKRFAWMSVQVGFPYYESLLSNFGLSINYSTDKRKAIYILQYKKTKYNNNITVNDIKEISYLSGYLLSDNKLRMSFCAGLSYLFMDEIYLGNSSLSESNHLNYLGVPIEAQYYLRLNRSFGFGISLRANLNGYQNFYQLGTFILLGKIK